MYWTAVVVKAERVRNRAVRQVIELPMSLHFVLYRLFSRYEEKEGYAWEVDDTLQSFQEPGD